MTLIDQSTEFGKRATARLDSEAVGWLTTAGKSGTPAPNPVWFLWHDDTLLVFSQPDTPKLRNIARNPRVSFNLNGDSTGGAIVILSGTATVDAGGQSDAEIAAYVAKYAEHIKHLGMTNEQFFADYSVLVRIAPDRIRGF
ncbi:PNPOx family protein [Flindersiella endophytica]